MLTESTVHEDKMQDRMLQRGGMANELDSEVSRFGLSLKWNSTANKW